MKKVNKLLGTFLLNVAALIIVIGPASINGIAVEEIPESIKKMR